MKNEKLKIAIIVLFFSFSNIVFAQKKDSIFQTTKDIEESYITVDINYISDAIFMGRKDSITAPYLYPSITYHHNSGFYATGSFSYLTKSDEGRVDLSLITVGYDFTVKNFSGDVSVTKYFFNDESFNVISEVEADVTANLIYDLDIINLSLGASSYFNNNSTSDFFLSSEISHDFITSDIKYQISPSAGIYLGSQNFYEEYYMSSRFGNRRGSGRGSGSGNNMQTTTNISIQDSEKFNLMAVEFGLPMWYIHKSLTISFLPALVVPQSEATIVVDETVVKENLEETFYWMVGFSYKF